MILAGLGCVALFFIGPPGGTAGSIPSPTSDPTPAQETGGGPGDEILYLSIPKIGLEDMTVYNSYSEESLEKSLIHLPDTGFPWQPGRTPTSPDTAWASSEPILSWSFSG